MDIVNEPTGEVRTEWVTIRYDYLPKYCKECKLQGHHRIECWRINPELRESKNVQQQENVAIVQQGNKKPTKHDVHVMILTSGKVVGNVGPQWKEVRDNRGLNKGKQTEGSNKEGKEMVPVNNTPVTKQIQTTNQFAVLEIENGETNEGNQLAVVEESPVQKTTGNNDIQQNNCTAGVENELEEQEFDFSTRQMVQKVTSPSSSRRQSSKTQPKKLNHAAPTFNPTAIRNHAANRESIADCVQQHLGNEQHFDNYSTAQWVQEAFKNNVVQVNTSCQDIPSQDTKVEQHLANNKEIELIEDIDFEKFRTNEKDKWAGGRLWINQIEEVLADGQIPDTMHSEEEIGGNEVEDEDQSVNCNANAINIQSISECTNPAAEKTKEGNINIIDPGGTLHNDVSNVLKEAENADKNQEKNSDKNQEKNSDKNQEKTVQVYARSVVLLSTVKDEAGSVVPSNNTQLLTNEHEEKAAELTNQEKDAELTNQAYDVVTSKEAIEAHDQVGHAEHKGRDMDEESTTQNFLNVAKQGDLSPRLIDIVKSATKGKKK
ncbi:uncharacterized protein [Nicotiana sylvestris]|uniref:uncharacterized protein n=1 Tax=Nicotiana sylvestris TaxID=4096 RepID=UPI00388CA66C